MREMERRGSCAFDVARIPQCHRLSQWVLLAKYEFLLAVRLSYVRNIPERSEESLEEEYGVWVGDRVEKVAVPKSGDLGSPGSEEV